MAIFLRYLDVARFFVKPQNASHLRWNSWPKGKIMTYLGNCVTNTGWQVVSGKQASSCTLIVGAGDSPPLADILPH